MMAQVVQLSAEAHCSPALRGRQKLASQSPWLAVLLPVLRAASPGAQEEQVAMKEQPAVC